MELAPEFERNILEVLFDAKDPAEGLMAAATLLCIYDLDGSPLDREHALLASHETFAEALKQRFPNLLERVRAIAARRLAADKELLQSGAHHQYRSRAAGA